MEPSSVKPQLVQACQQFLDGLKQAGMCK